MAENKLDKQYLLWLVLGLVAAIGLKLWLVAGDYVPFNSDEAVVALMARHILEGARPTFFYGQAYMGSLDAYLVALGFATFGQSVWVIRLVQSLLYLGTLLTTAWLGKEVFGSWSVGSLATLLLAIPVVNVTLYTTASLGGYGEALLIGNLILICGLRIVKNLEDNHNPGRPILWLVLGALAGIGLWAFGLTLVYSLPVGLFCLISIARMVQRIRSKKDSLEIALDEPVNRSWFLKQVVVPLGVALIGVLVGSFPLWGYAATQGLGEMIWELRGGAIYGVEQLPWILRVWQHVIGLILLGGTVLFGLRPPWEVSWLALPLLPFVLLFWMAAIVHVVQSLRDTHRDRIGQLLIISVILTLSLGFLFTPFGVDPSGRYFVPIAVPLSLFAASMILSLVKRYGKFAFGLVLLLLVFQLWGNIQSALRFPPGITTQFYKPAQVDHRYMGELIEFLRDNDESYGYTNYWISYPMAFLSSEMLIYIPRLPYHPDFRYTERDDRYSPYGKVVAKADKVAYITSNHPDLEDYLREHFGELGVSWQEHRIGDYQIFYDLSQVVRPAEIGLGITSTGLDQE